MKLITFAVPSYNSEAYMRNCIDSILKGGEDVEIIIVDDGSKDGTGKIADEYEAAYPTICRAVHQENGGHGVNQGIRHATGLYYKVVDSDDWVDETALRTVLDTVKKHLAENTLPDMYVTNFVYEHVEDNSAFARKFTKNMPTGRFFGWEDTKPFKGCSCTRLCIRRTCCAAAGFSCPSTRSTSTIFSRTCRCRTSEKCITSTSISTAITSAAPTSP